MHHRYRYPTLKTTILNYLLTFSRHFKLEIVTLCFNLILTDSQTRMNDNTLKTDSMLETFFLNSMQYVRNIILTGRG